MVASPETVSTFLIVVTIIHVLAVILTSFRLWFRYRTRRLWWDDFWAALTLVTGFINMTVEWIVFAPLDNPYTNFEALPTPAQSRSAHVMTAWLMIIFYTTSIWFSRVSIVCSVVRVVPPSGSSGIAIILSCVLFFCLWVYMMLCKIIPCSANDSWHDNTIIQCPLPEWVVISEACTDVVADIILVALPLCLLWPVKLPSRQRIMLLSIFSTSILVSIISVVHTLYILHSVSFLGMLTAELCAAVSLIVCNMLVIVNVIYRVMRHDVEISTSGAKGYSSHRLTTVDLDYQGTWCSDRLETGFTNTAITGTNISSIVFARDACDDEREIEKR